MQSRRVQRRSIKLRRKIAKVRLQNEVEILEIRQFLFNFFNWDSLHMDLQEKEEGTDKKDIEKLIRKRPNMEGSY